MMLYLVHLCIFFDYVSTWEFGSKVSETFDIEKIHMQFSHALLLQRINAMCAIIFIFMLLFLALANLFVYTQPSLFESIHYGA